MILKDNNNLVRDSAVNMLFQFKVKLGDTDPERVALVENAISQLPKNRIAEIKTKSEALNPQPVVTEPVVV